MVCQCTVYPRLPERTRISVGFVDPHFSIAGASSRGIVGADRLLLQRLFQTRVGLLEKPCLVTAAGDGIYTKSVHGLLLFFSAVCRDWPRESSRTNPTVDDTEDSIMKYRTVPSTTPSFGVQRPPYHSEPFGAPHYTEPYHIIPYHAALTCSAR